jgi:hypothetical protein
MPREQPGVEQPQGDRNARGQARERAKIEISAVEIVAQHEIRRRTAGQLGDAVRVGIVEVFQPEIPLRKSPPFHGRGQLRIHVRPIVEERTEVQRDHARVVGVLLPTSSHASRPRSTSPSSTAIDTRSAPPPRRRY